MAAAAVVTQPPPPQQPTAPSASTLQSQSAVRGPPGQPDIQYTPNYDNYLARVKRRQETEPATLNDRSLPAGLPQKLESPLVWTGESLLAQLNQQEGDTSTSQRFDWAHHLSETEIGEVDAALQHFKSLNKPLGEISQETFPLPTLHATLRAISNEIHNGHGFKVVRGVPVERYSREENVIIYAGISAHVAPIRGRQDHQWQGQPADVVMAHIKDLTSTAEAGKIGSPAYTTEKQVFHTDSGDVISLFCLGEAHHGGQSWLSSSWHVYNELAATRPDLIRTLAEPWAVDEFGKLGKSYTVRPLLHYQPATDTSPERVIIHYARRYFTGHGSLTRSVDIPAITEAQAEALDALHFAAEKHAITLDFRQGDIQYANNLSLFHARDGFTDSAEKQRHLVRFWLRDPEYAWKTPDVLQERWDKVYKGVTPEKTIFPLEPIIRNESRGTEVPKK